MRLVFFTLLLLISAMFTDAYAQENISAYKIVEPGQSLNKALSSVPLFGLVIKDGSISGKILIVRKNDKIEVELDGISKQVNSRSSIFKFDWKNSSVSVDLDKLKASTKSLINDSDDENYELVKLFDSQPLNAKVTSLETEINGLEMELEQYSANALNSKSEINKFEKKLANSQSRVSELEASNKDLKNENQDLKLKLSDTESRITDLEKRNKTIKGEMKQLKTQLKEKKESLLKTAKNSSKRILELETVAETSNQTIKDQSERIASLEKDYEKLKLDYSSLEILYQQSLEKHDAVDTVSINDNGTKKQNEKQKITADTENKGSEADVPSISKQPQNKSFDVLFESCADNKDEESCESLGAFLSEKVESANITAGCKVMFLDMQLSLFEFVDASDTDVALSFNDESLKNCM